jgi:2-phosphosulfolactate phosphatase
VLDVSVEWGVQGARHLAGGCDVLVIVDVLSFSTAVTVAVERGAKVWPHTGGEEARVLAREIGAILAGNRGSHDGPTLSPVSLAELAEGSRLVLPSANGFSISSAAVSSGVPLVVGCLRNALAAAQHVAGYDRIGIVPAGERWADGSLRPAYEDWIGAGALVERLLKCVPGTELSPQAEAAAAAFRLLRPLTGCPCGADLAERGFLEDVHIAAEVDATDVVPVLRDGRFVAG